MCAMFCEKCGGVLAPKKLSTGKRCMVCISCGKKHIKNGGKVTEKTTDKKDRIIVVTKKSEAELPKTKVECPKCKNDEAYYWSVQTRASDESPTTFFKCCKCEHRWRKYD